MWGPANLHVGFREPTCGVPRTYMWGSANLPSANLHVGFREPACGVPRTYMWGSANPHVGFREPTYEVLRRYMRGQDRTLHASSYPYPLPLYSLTLLTCCALLFCGGSDVSARAAGRIALGLSLTLATTRMLWLLVPLRHLLLPLLSLLLVVLTLAITRVPSR